MSWIATGVGVAGSLAGGYMSGQAGGGQEMMTFDDVYGPNAGHMQNLTNQVMGLKPGQYGENRLAGKDPWMNQASNEMYNFTQGRGQNIEDLQFGQGRQGLDALSGGMDFAGNAASGDPNAFFNQGVYDMTMQNLQPGMQGAYDAAMRDPTRQFEEQMIPGITSNAFMSGTSGSSGMGTNAALAERGLMDRGADTASNIWMNAANQAQGNAMEAGAGSIGAIGNLYNNMAGQGLPGLGDSYKSGMSNPAILAGLGDTRRGWEQERIDERSNRWDFNQDKKYIDLKQKMDLLNSTRIQGAMDSGTSQSTLDGMLSGGTAALGLYDALFPQGINFGGGGSTSAGTLGGIDISGWPT